MRVTNLDGREQLASKGSLRESRGSGSQIRSETTTNLKFITAAEVM